MNKLKNSRAMSFIAVTLVYIIAAIIGIVTYQAINETFDWWISLLIADVAATVATFIFSTIFRNASVFAGATANTILFFAVSIPMADERQSHKESFAEYKRETRILFPIKRFKR